MMKRLTIAFLLVCVLSTQAAQAQVKFGLKGGVELLDMKFKEDVFNASNRLGWFAGPILYVGLPLPGLGFDISALYNQRETEIDLFTSTEVGSATSRQTDRLKTHLMAVPLNLRYSLPLGSSFDVFVYAGPQMAFNVGKQEQDLDGRGDESELVWRVKESSFSVNGGIGLTLGPVQITANYNVALGRTGDVTFKQAMQAAEDGINGKYNSWQIGAAYFF
jgi:hypothetical protein